VPIDHPDPADDPGEPDHPRPPDSPRPPDASPTPPPGRPDRTAANRAYHDAVDRAYAAYQENPAASTRGRAGDADHNSWPEALPSLRAAWEEHQKRYPERERLTPQTHTDGSWSCGDTRRLSADQNAAVDRGYACIREIGERDIVPGMLAVEAEDPTRHLAGFDRHIKGVERLKEKIADQMRSTPGLSPTQALEVIADVVRFTFQYGQDSYATGVRQDIGRLQARGFVEVERRNTWESEQYKGINGRWREPESGVLFEVQFHTQASLDAKELTHKAYERIRSTAQDPELSELKVFQRHVNSMIPLPPGVADVENYPPGDT
jgi:hypothetical protein